MTKMTPETVRKQTKNGGRLGILDTRRLVLLWEADLKRLEAWRKAYNMLAGHVECAKVIRWCTDCDGAHKAALAVEKKP